MFRHFLEQRPTVQFSLTLARRFWFLLLPLVITVFVASITESFGVTIFIPFFAVLSGATYDATNTVVTFVYSLIARLPFRGSPAALLFFISCTFFLRAFFLWLSSFLQSMLSFRLSIMLRQQFLLLVYDASWLFLLKQKLGHIQNVMSRDLTQVVEFFSVIINFTHTTILFFVYLAFAFVVSPSMTMIAFVTGTSFFLLLRFLTATLHRYAGRIAELEKDFSQYMYQLTAGIKMVKSGIQRMTIVQHSEQFVKDFFHNSFRFSLAYPLGTIFFQPLAVLIVFVVFFFSYHRPDFQFGIFVVLLYLIYRIISQLQSLQGILQAIAQYLPYARDFAQFHYALVAAREDVTPGSRPFLFERDFRFKGVTFAYADRPATFHNLDLIIRKGESVGLIGHSGAGKTTLADLTLRLFRPQSGGIFLDDVPAEEINLHDWRRNIGYVSQDTFVLHDTIRNNIRFYDERVSDERIVAATKQAYIYDFINELPHGLDTLVGDRGVMLSVGQRQRLILARMFARDPQLLILDEATSALDNESESIVHQAIDVLHGRMTMLIIAHRLSTVMNVDRLLVLRDGRIVEEGAPKILLENPSSYFYQMYHLKDH